MVTKTRPEGRAHRARLRGLIVPRLFVGARIPSGDFLGRLLGISGRDAARHMAKVLAEDGITTEARGPGGGHRRHYVTALPEGRKAA